MNSLEYAVGRTEDAVAWRGPPRRRPGRIVAAALVLSYWDAFSYLYASWSTEDYGYCFLVPPFAVFLLWYRRDKIMPLPERGSWWGLAFLALCGILRWASVWFAMVTSRTAVAGSAVRGTGRAAGRLAGIALGVARVADAAVHVSLPGQFQFGLRYELQHTATWRALSAAVVWDSHARSRPAAPSSRLPSGPLQVEEACSGLRMLMLFQTACVGAAFVVRAPLWQKIVIVVSGTPIAVLSNVLRITLTGVVQELFSLEAEATGHVHDFAGLLMMPLALLFIWGEVDVVAETVRGAVVAGRRRADASAGRHSRPECPQPARADAAGRSEDCPPCRRRRPGVVPRSSDSQHESFYQIHEPEKRAMYTNDSASLPGDLSTALAAPVRPSTALEHANGQWVVPQVVAPARPAASGAVTRPASPCGVTGCWLSVLGLLCAAAAGPAVFFGYGPRYESSAFLRISPQEKVIFGRSAADSVSSVASEFDIYKATQQQLIKTRFVLSHAAARPGRQGTQSRSTREGSRGRGWRTNCG